MSAPNDAKKRIADLRLLKLVVCNIAITSMPVASTLLPCPMQFTIA